MTVELNCKKYRVKRYKGEEISVYYSKGILLDTLPKHRSLYGVFIDDIYGVVGVVDRVPTVITLLMSLIMLCLTAIFVAVSIESIIDENKFEVYIATIDIKDVTIVPEAEDYEHNFEFNRCARLKDKTLNVNATSVETCNMSIIVDDYVVHTQKVYAGEYYNPEIETNAENVTLLVDYGNESYTNIIVVTERNIDNQRTLVKAVNGEIMCKLVRGVSSVNQYAYHKDNKYVEAEIITIQGVKCVHILSNCDISKSYWNDDYHTPVVIGYTDSDTYNMILGNGDKKNVPDNVKIINNMFSISTVDTCYENYFTYEEVNGSIEMYVPLGTVSSEQLPLGDNAIVVPSDSMITVQINSNIVQAGKDNIHAVLLK